MLDRRPRAAMMGRPFAQTPLEPSQTAHIRPPQSDHYFLRNPESRVVPLDKPPRDYSSMRYREPYRAKGQALWNAARALPG
eukprot:8802199-Pyramimonas_sp.AAC.1